MYQDAEMENLHLETLFVKRINSMEEKLTGFDHKLTGTGQKEWSKGRVEKASIKLHVNGRRGVGP